MASGASAYRTALLLRTVAMAGIAIGQLVLQKLLVERLGDHVLASWNLVSQTAILLFMLDVGFGTVVVRRARIQADDGAFRASLKLLHWIAGGLCLVTLVGLAVAGPLILGFTGIEARDMRIISLLFAALLLVRYRAGLGQWRWYQDEDPRPSALAEVAMSVLRPAAAIGAVLLGGQVIAVAAAWCLSELIVVLLIAWRTTAPPTGSANQAQMCAIISDGLGVAGIALVSSIPVYLSGWAIGRWSDVAMVNMWQCSLALPLLGLRLAYLPQTVAFPAMARELPQLGIARFLRQHRGWITLYVAALLVGASALIPLTGPFVAVWMGERYVAGIAATAGMAAWVVVTTLRAGVQLVVLASSDRRLGLVLAHGMEIALIVVFAGWVIPTFGLFGFAILLVIAHAVPLVVSAIMAARIEPSAPTTMGNKA